MRKHDRDDTREVVRLKGEWTQRGFCGQTLTEFCKRARRDPGLVLGDDGVAAQDGALSSYSIPQIPPEGYIWAAHDDQTSGVKLWLDTLQGGALLGRQPSLRLPTPAKLEPWLCNGSSVRPRQPPAFRDAAMLATCNRAIITIPDPPGLSTREANNGCCQAILQLDDPGLPSIPARDNPAPAEVRSETTPYAVARNSINPEDTVIAGGAAAEKLRCHQDDLPRFTGGHQFIPGVNAQDGEVLQVPPGRRAPMLSPFAVMSASAFHDDLKDNLSPAKDSERPPGVTCLCPGDSRLRQGVELTPTKRKVSLPGGSPLPPELKANAKRSDMLSHLRWIDDDDIDDGGWDPMLIALLHLHDMVLNDHPRPEPFISVSAVNVSVATEHHKSAEG
ncbi:hypothetical protein Vafri_15340 [Volvox africanus]|uniref:Uncharacterized protein n=1 Tax=Volvox africanus TaxID=51714 RepID=A0A8J4F8J8_9CHLO|nr:hypothetical protein Vafri_15340 [Volvox africanus]